jgi:hypothetical protein
VEIDYGLVSNANFTQKGRVVTDHKGEFLLSGNPQDPPFSPPPLPDPSADHFNESKMVYVIATTYVAESASYAFWKAGLMQYNTSSDVGKTCDYCSFIPELCNTFRDNKVKFGVAASKYPRLNVTEDYATMSADASLSMYVDNNGTEELAFSLVLSVQADVKIYLRTSETGGHIRYFICGDITDKPRIDVSPGKSNIGHFNYSKLNNIIQILAPTGIGFINKYTKAGFPIPMIDKRLRFTSPSLKLGKGYVVVGSDVQYKEATSSSCDYDNY